MAKRLILVPAFLMLVAAAAVVAPSRAQSATPPNIVLILTDDQRWDTLWAMPTVKAELIDRGVKFTRSFVMNPSCCPSRASTLTGLSSGHNGVWKNRPPDGGFESFDDSSTIATRLHDAGYRTGLFGKYLNGYRNTTYVPPGWDRWFATYKDSAYYDYKAVDDGVLVTYGSAPADYGPYVAAQKVDEFIRSADAATPLFVYFAPHSPHQPAIPGPGDETAFSGLPPWRPPSYNEADVSDKPAYVAGKAPLGSTARSAIDAFRKDQYRTLLGVDRTVAQLLTALSETGRLQNTLIVFTSDNGYLWGEHRLRGKAVPYEESIRVPMVIRYDAIRTTPARSTRLVQNVDLAPTFAEVAGLAPVPTDGLSLLPLLGDPSAPSRLDLLLEHLGPGTAPSYCGVRSSRFAYVVYTTAEEELYVLPEDADQLVNVASDPVYASILAALRLRVQELCNPPPPDFTFPPW